MTVPADEETHAKHDFIVSRVSAVGIVIVGMSASNRLVEVHVWEAG